MKDKFFLVTSFIFITIGLFKFDTFVIPTLDYFGKFVFFGALNFFAYYFIYTFWKFMLDKKPIIGDIIILIVSAIFMIICLQKF